MSTKTSTKNIHKKCPQKVSTNSVQNKCPQKFSTKIVYKKCPQSVHKKCPQQVSIKSVQKNIKKSFHKKGPQKESIKVRGGKKGVWPMRGLGTDHVLSGPLRPHTAVSEAQWILVLLQWKIGFKSASSLFGLVQKDPGVTWVACVGLKACSKWSLGCARAFLEAFLDLL